MAKTTTRREKLDKAKRELKHSKEAVSRWTRRLRVGTTKLRSWSRRVARLERSIEELEKVGESSTGGAAPRALRFQEE